MKDIEYNQKIQKLREERNQKILKLRKTLTLIQIGERFGMAKETVRKVLKGMGYEKSHQVDKR